MTVERGLINKFNRGVVSETFFAREDVDRVTDSCELMTNFMPKRLGPMVYRPGMEYLDTLTHGNGVMIPFVSAADRTAFLVWEQETSFPFNKWWQPYVDGVCPQITNTISTGGTWTDVDEGSAVSSLGANGNFVEQLGTGTDAAIVTRNFTGLTLNELNYIEIVVLDGPVRFRMGSLQELGDFFDEELDVGHHIFGHNPGPSVTTVWVTVSNYRAYTTRVERCSNPNTGDFRLYPNFLDIFDQITGFRYDLNQFARELRYDQSADKLYMACEAHRPMVITRYDDNSWGASYFRNQFGPYDVINISNVTCDPSVASGDASLLFSEKIINGSQSHWAGSIIRYAVQGQTVTATGSTNGTVTDGVLVFGTGDSRGFKPKITTTGAYNDIALEKSFDNVTWLPVKNYTTGTNQLDFYDDQADGAEIYYRLQIIDVGAATSVTLEIEYDYGIIEGQWRQREDDGSYSTDSTFQGYWEIPAGGDTASVDWYLGSWRWLNSSRSSFDRNAYTWPSAVAFFEGRLWFGGNNKFWASESDFYQSFDRNVEGDSASIQRTIGFGPVEQISWMVGTDYLFAGIPSAEINIRSNNRAVPLTPTNTNVKQASSTGSANIRPAVFDNNVLFAQRGKDKVMSMGFDGEKSVMSDLMLFAPDILSDGIRRIEMTRNPENRCYVLTETGDIWVALLEPVEDVLAWSKVETEGTIIDMVALPKDGEDELYLQILRQGSYLIERFSQFRESVGGVESKHFDSWVRFDSPVGTIDMSHITGATVTFWSDGVRGTTAPASAGTSGFTPGASVVYCGIEHTAQYKSNKLTGFSDIGILNSRKRIINTGFILRNYYYAAGTLQIGPDFSNLGNMPLLEDGKAPASGSYDYFPFTFNGVSETDPRICIQAVAPVEIMALGYDVKDTTNRTPKKRDE